MQKPVNQRFTGFLAVWTRLELATPCVTGRYSNQLNYQTNFFNHFSLSAAPLTVTDFGATKVVLKSTLHTGF